MNRHVISAFVIAGWIGMAFTSRAQVNLKPNDGRLLGNYEHTYTIVGVQDGQRALSNMAYASWGDQAFYRVSTGTVGTASWSFSLAPPDDNPLATLRNLIVTPRANDWSGGAGNGITGAFTSNLSGSPVTFFDVGVDGQGMVRKDLANYAVIAGMTDMTITFTVDIGTANRDHMRLMSAHHASIPQFTWSVTAVYEDPDTGHYPVPVINGSFEGPNLNVVNPFGFTNWTRAPTPWSIPANPTSEYVVHKPPSTFSALPDGQQVLNVQPDPIIQNVGATEAGRPYELSFWLGSRVGESGRDVRVEILDDGVAFASEVFTPPSDDAWEQFTLLGTAPQTPSGQLSISFVNIHESRSNPVFLDDVQLMAIPEPHGVALLALGAVLLGLRRRRGAA